MFPGMWLKAMVKKVTYTHVPGLWLKAMVKKATYTHVPRSVVKGYG